MALCGGATVCNCAFQSSSLTFDGTGNPGDPLVIETYEGVVADQSDVTSPFLGQRIYETSTDRLLYYDGSNWIIHGGNIPRFQVERQTSQTIVSDSPTNVAFTTEIYDTDAFHVANADTVVIPSGLGGDWLFVGHATWAASATGYRAARISVGSNAGVPTQNNQSRSGGWGLVNTAVNGYVVTEIFRVEPGAVIALAVTHNAGADTTITSAGLKGVMLHHDPTLT